MSAEAYAAQAEEMDARADERFSVESADMFRAMAAQWRLLKAEAEAITQGDAVDSGCTSGV